MQASGASYENGGNEFEAKAYNSTFDSTMDSSNTFENPNWKSALSIVGLHEGYKRLQTENIDLNAQLQETKIALGKSRSAISTGQLLVTPAELAHVREERDDAVRDLHAILKEQAECTCRDLSKNNNNSHTLLTKTIDTLQESLNHANERCTNLAAQLEELGYRHSQTQHEIQVLQDNKLSFDSHTAASHAKIRASLFRIILRRSYRRCMHNGLSIWQAHTRSISNNEKDSARIRHTLKRWHQQQVTKSFSTWAHNARVRAQHRRLCTQFMQRWKAYKEHSALARWRATVHRRRTLRRLCCRLSARAETRCKIAAFSLWRRSQYGDVLDEQREMVHALTLQLKDATVTQNKLTNREENWLDGQVRAKILKQHFASLHEYSRQQVRRHKLLSQFVGMMRARASTRAFTHWREITSRRNDAKAKTWRILSRVSQRLLTKGFETWRASTRIDRRSMALRRKIVGNMRSRMLACAFAGWRARHDHVIEKRRVVARTAHVLSKRALFRSFSAWQHVAYAQQEEKQRQDSQMRGVVVRIQRGKLVRGFQAWAEVSKQNRRRTVVVERFLVRVRGQTLGALMRGWSVVAKRESARKRILTKVASRWCQSQIQRAIVIWRLHTGAAVSDLAVGVLQTQSASLREELELEKQRNLDLQKSLDESEKERQELEFTFASVVEQRDIMRKEQAQSVINRWRNHSLSFAFNSFKTNCVERKRSRAILMKLETRVRKVKVLSALYEWRKLTMEAKRTHEKMKLIVGRWKTNVEMRSWRAWVEYTQLRRNRNTVTARANRIMSNGKRVRTFRAWHMLTVDSKSVRDIVYDRADKVKLHVSKELTVRVFEAWRQATVRARRIKESVVRISERRNRKHIDTVMGLWIEHVRMRKHSRLAFACLLRRNHLSFLSASLHKWTRVVSRVAAKSDVNKVQASAVQLQVQLQGSSANIGKLQDDLKDTESQLRNTQDELLTTHGKLTTTENYLTTAQDELAIAQDVGAQLQTQLDMLLGHRDRVRDLQIKRTLRSLHDDRMDTAFNALQEFTAKRKTARFVVSRVLNRAREAKIRYALRMWRTNVHSTTRLNAVLGKFTAKMERQTTVRVFASWREMVLHTAKTKAKVNMFVSRRLGHTRLRCWQIWVRYLVRTRERRIRAMQANARLSNNMLARSFHSWRTVSASVKQFRRSEHDKLKHVLMRLSRGCMARAFESLKVYVEYNRHVKDVTLKLMKQRSLRRVERSMRVWKGRVAFFKRRKHLMVRVLGRARHKALSGSWMRWVLVSELSKAQEQHRRDLEHFTELFSASIPNSPASASSRATTRTGAMMRMRASSPFSAASEPDLALSVPIPVTHNRMRQGFPPMLNVLTSSSPSSAATASAARNHNISHTAHHLPKSFAGAISARRVLLKLQQHQEELMGEAQALRDQQVRRMIQRWRRESISRAFQGWIATVARAKQMRGIMRIHVLRWKHITGIRCLRAWKLHVQQTVTMRHALDRLSVKRVGGQQVRTCLLAWRRLVHTRKTRARRLVDCLERVEQQHWQRMVGRAWRVWSRYVIESVSYRMTLKIEESAVTMQVEAVKLRKQLASRLLWTNMGRVVRGIQTRALVQWRQFASDTRMQNLNEAGQINALQHEDELHSKYYDVASAVAIATDDALVISHQKVVAAAVSSETNDDSSAIGLSDLNSETLRNLVRRVNTSSKGKSALMLYVVDDTRAGLWSVLPTLNEGTSRNRRSYLDRDTDIDMYVKFGEGISGHVANVGRPIVLVNARLDSRFRCEVDNPATIVKSGGNRSIDSDSRNGYVGSGNGYIACGNGRIPGGNGYIDRTQMDRANLPFKSCSGTSISSMMTRSDALSGGHVAATVVVQDALNLVCVPVLGSESEVVGVLVVTRESSIGGGECNQNGTTGSLDGNKNDDEQFLRSGNMFLHNVSMIVSAALLWTKRLTEMDQAAIDADAHLSRVVAASEDADAKIKNERMKEITAWQSSKNQLEEQLAAALGRLETLEQEQLHARAVEDELVLAQDVIRRFDTRSHARRRRSLVSASLASSAAATHVHQYHEEGEERVLEGIGSVGGSLVGRYPGTVREGQGHVGSSVRNGKLWEEVNAFRAASSTGSTALSNPTSYLGRSAPG